MADTFLITAGDVIDVQLTSETVVIEGAGGRRDVQAGHITNRVRLFVREDGGREQKYDFEDTELGVRETQRVAIVRGRPRKAKEPVNLLLYNLSTGEKDTFERGLFAYLFHPPVFAAPLKAFVFALAIAVIYWFVSRFLYEQGPITSGVYAGIWGFLLFPVLWWLCGIWDRVSGRIRYDRARKAFITDMDARAKALAKP